MNIEKLQFGTAGENRIADLFILKNDSGFSASVTTYGGILTSVKMPDKRGSIDEITLGFNNLQGYLSDHPYFGAIVGRFANRIAGGKFTLDGKTYTLFQNNGNNHLHGGKEGFDKKLWEGTSFDNGNEVGVKLTYTSPDREEGYPGKLSMSVTYTLTEKNDLIIAYEAVTDKATPVNLTNHAYWNLAGSSSDSIYSHELILYADNYLPVNDELIPTGEIRPVDNTLFDFRKKKKIGRDIEEAGGFDHCYILQKTDSTLSPAAEVYDPSSGRTMKVFTSQPAIQLYTGNFLEGTAGRDERVHKKHCAFCLETQGYPDAVNQPDFPSVILRPGETYLHTTKHSFSV